MTAKPETEIQEITAVKVGGKKSGAWLARYALEQLPVSHTFGIPGVHNTELYDELGKSEKIRPVLVTHECGGAFAADAISRTSPDGRIGCLVIVPAAGITHAMSGISEAYLDGIPMLVLSGGIRTDVPYGFQLHDIDQHKLLAGITKGTWRIKEHREIVPAIFEAYRLAVSGKPGPVFIADKKAYKEEWYAHVTDRVNPAKFLDELRRQLDDDAIVVVDDGNHTFLAAELFMVKRPRTFISPTDFNCMGYAVPAGIGAKLVNPEHQVVGIVGDGAFLMTGMEILTATTENTGVAYFVFYDGELSQISQGQEIPYNRKTCTVLGNVELKGIATATGAGYVAIHKNDDIADGIREALATAANGQPVVADVRIDYSKRTRFTKGVVNTVLKRFPLGDKFRFIGRAMWRKMAG